MKRFVVFKESDLAEKKRGRTGHSGKKKGKHTGELGLIAVLVQIVVKINQKGAILWRPNFDHSCPNAPSRRVAAMPM